MQMQLAISTVLQCVANFFECLKLTGIRRNMPGLRQRWDDEMKVEIGVLNVTWVAFLSMHMIGLGALCENLIAPRCYFL
jgi:hypothetical protein